MPSRLRSPLSGHHLPLGYLSTAAVYLLPPAILTGTAVAVNGACHFTWMPLSTQYRLIGLGANMTLAGTDNAQVARFGIYTNGLQGYPTSLMLDAGVTNCGTQSGVSAPAPLLSPPFDLTLSPGGYWACVVIQGVTGTGPTMTRVTNSAIPHLGTPSPDSNIYISFVAPGVTGPLPSVMGVSPFFLTRQTSYISVAPQVVLANG